MIPQDFKSKYEGGIQVVTKYKNVFIDICQSSFEYKIIEVSPEGKLKVRRRNVGRVIKKNKVKENNLLEVLTIEGNLIGEKDYK